MARSIRAGGGEWHAGNETRMYTRAEREWERAVIGLSASASQSHDDDDDDDDIAKLWISISLAVCLPWPGQITARLSYGIKVRWISAGFLRGSYFLSTPCWGIKEQECNLRLLSSHLPLDPLGKTSTLPWAHPSPLDYCWCVRGGAAKQSCKINQSTAEFTLIELCVTFNPSLRLNMNMHLKSLK